MDFARDQLALDKKQRILAIVDTYSRYCPAEDVRFLYRGEDVVATLERMCAKVDYPKTIRVEMAANSSCATWICGPAPRA